MKLPVVHIQTDLFTADPYPILARMRAETPVCHVPELDATLIVCRDDIFNCEKMIDVFSSEQPGGLMTVLMGENMMRRDGEPHQQQRRAAFPALSPRTVRDRWTDNFVQETKAVLDALDGRQRFDLVQDFALLVSGHALRHITGLLNLSPQDMDAVSQAMIDGISNYAGDPQIEATCHQATARIDTAINAQLDQADDLTLIGAMRNAGQPIENIRANIKLAISGGQNEPRDVISGAAWAMLHHRDQLELALQGQASWMQVFEEYTRWISPIGMSPRRVAKNFVLNGFDLEPEMRAFFMFSSGNRDEAVFERADIFDITRDTTKSISFGAGPHFCAGAAASKVLIAGVALPMLFQRFPAMQLDAEVIFAGWAFRGPQSVWVRV